ncbi:hypothetical protein THAOC_24157, partial [Thalassiosira oceanica]
MSNSISSEKEDSRQTFESEIDDAAVAFKNDIDSFAKRVDSHERIKSSRMAEELSLEGERLFKHLGDFYHEGVANIKKRVLASMGCSSIEELTDDEQEQFVETWYEELLAWEMIYGDMLDGTLTCALKKLNKINDAMAIKNETSAIEKHVDVQDECVETITFQMRMGSQWTWRIVVQRKSMLYEDLGWDLKRTKSSTDLTILVGSSSNGWQEIAPSHARRASNVEAGATPRPNTDHEMRTSSMRIDDCEVEGAMDDTLDSTNSVKQIVKKSSAFDVELRAMHEARAYKRGAQLLLGFESREADLTTKCKARATLPSRNQKKSKGGRKSRGSRELSAACLSSVVSVLVAMLMGIFILFVPKEMSSAFFVVAEGTTSGGLQSFDHFNIADEQSPFSALSSNLRGGADPATILPEIHSVIQSQRRMLQEVYDLYEEGDSAAFNLAFKSLAGEASGEETSLETHRPQLVGFFDPAFLIEVLANLKTLDEILEDVIGSNVILRPQQLLEPEMTETVTGRRLKDTDGAGIPIDADATDTSYQLPTVCTDECAPTDTSCLCERLSNCTKTMTHYDLAVLFAGGYIQNDT